MPERLAMRGRFVLGSAWSIAAFGCAVGVISACSSAATQASASAPPPALEATPPRTHAQPGSAPPAAGSSTMRPTSNHRACGALDCKAFPNALLAFQETLLSEPRVLAIGEAHRQADASGPSTTRRFMEELLPSLAPRASDLILEIWLANGSCGKVEQQVQTQQQVVTAPQASTNQGEFFELGTRAKSLGIMPRALVPSCEQYRKIAGAGARDIEEMLRMLRDVTEKDALELMSKRSPERTIVLYGGAMHNDLQPRAGREDFSFGPSLAHATGDRYVEVDLITPEQIKDTETWRALPWFEHYPRTAAPNEAYLFSWAPRAFALIFPPSPKEP